MKQQLALFLLLLGLSSTLNAQWFSFSAPGIPRTADGRADLNAPTPIAADGHVDMSGLWVPSDATGTLFDSSKIQGWALDAMLEQKNTFYVNSPRFNCLPSGPGSYPAGPSVGGSRRMVQHPTMIAVLSPEMNYRQIYMDGRELEESPMLPTWMGYSVAHWEGEVLVVESNGYNDKTWLTREGLPHTEQLRITERYRRLDFGHIELEVTYQDPGTFTETVYASIDLAYRDADILEAVCTESKTGQNHYSGEITQAEEKVVVVSEATLASYVGTYQGVWLGNIVTVEIQLEDGEMSLVRTPRYSDTGGNTNSEKSRLVAQSQIAFDCSCGLGFIFEVNDEGVATSISEVHVSGAWPFERVE